MDAPWDVLLSAGLAAVLAAGAGAVPAVQAGPSPGWRIVEILEHCGNDSMSAVTATGPRDAWALGLPSGGGPGCGADVEHWDGMSWREVPVPDGVLVRPPSLVSAPVAASSATDAWIFPAVPASLPMSVYDYALHWNGTAWRRSAFPAHLTVTFAAAFGEADVWAFGGIDHADGTVLPYAARYDGHAWHKTVVPVAPLGISALSARDMWAVGPTRATAGKPLDKQVLLAAHWTGRRWRTMKVPTIKAPEATTSLSSGQVVAAGRDGIWWAYQVTAKEPSPAGLLHYYGGHWHVVKLPSAISGIHAMTQDGHGGVWLVADAGPFDNFLYHYNHGRWTRQLVPSPSRYDNTLSGMAWIPRTTSVWGVGEADQNHGNGTAGVIARYLR
jgi:hypothetical protein